MRTRWRGKRVKIRMPDDTVIDVTIVDAYRELGDWVYRIKYPSGDTEHIPKDVIFGFIEEPLKKPSPVVALRKKIRLVK